ncbi:hypothetical protein [Paenibacillus chungangensis]|uniref:ABC transporter substrate-binding protein n=1 Tax=Paenibacillus chungangensis TaxID=696535 RepID=A0ABW3HL04_9BACL
MITRNYTRWVKALAAGCLAGTLLLAGCSTNEPNNTGNGETTGEGAATEVEFPLAEPVTLKIYTIKNAVQKKEYNDLEYFKILKEQTNVNIDWTLMTQQNSAEVVNLAIASNDLPDAFYGSGALKDVVKNAADGVIIPLDELIEKYAPNVKAAFEKNPELKKSVTASDGQIYTLPNAVFNHNNNMIPSAMYINKKWLDDLGLSMPTTTDEFFEVLKAFRDGDPNGNGKKDEIPFSFLDLKHHFYSPTPLAGAFGKTFPSGTNGFWHVENGEVSFAPTLPENRDFLVYLNKLYQENLIDKEIFTHNVSVYKSKLTSKTPIVGVWFGWSDYSILGSTNTEYALLEPLKGPDGKAGWQIQDNNMNIDAFSITRANKHPEITMKWIDAALEPKMSFQANFGMINTAWKEEGDQLVPIPVPEGMTDMELRVSEAPGPQGVSIVLPDDVKAADPENEIVKAKINERYKPFTPDEWYPRAVLYSLEDEPAITAWGIDVQGPNGFLDQMLAKIVLEPNPEATWNEMVKQLEKMNLQGRTDIAQKYYDAIRK